MSPTATFDGEHSHWFTGERILQFKLRTGITASEVRDSQVRLEQIGAISQQSQGVVVEASWAAFVPQVLDSKQFLGFKHKRSPRSVGTA